MNINIIRSESGIVTRLAGRWLMISAAIIFAFWPTWKNLWHSAVDDKAAGFAFVLPLLCVVAAVGTDLRRGPELPIHDHETDKIVGGIGLIIALGMQALLLPRFADYYELMHIDVLAAWVFVWGAAVLMFGLRPVNRYRFIWLAPIILTPIFYQTMAIELGGTRFDYSIILVVFASMAITIAFRRTWHRGLATFLISLALGTVLAYYLSNELPDFPLFLVQFLPAVGTAVIIGGIFYLHERRGKSLIPFDRALRKPSAKPSNRTVLFMFGVAILISLAPLPDTDNIPITDGPPPTADPRLVVPTGWSQLSNTEFDWPQRYFGSTSTLTRQTIRTETPNPDWDALLRQRTVQIDVLQVRRSTSLDVYSGSSAYTSQNARVSPAVQVELTRGVTAEMYTIVDDDLLLTWSNLNFIWTRGNGTVQRVSLITVDNHEPNAYFPEPNPSMTSNGGNSLALLLRGKDSTADSESQYKDLGMLETLGQLIVETQQW